MSEKFPADETFSDEGPQCPHCGRQYTADGPWFYDEDECTGDTCDECGKPFKISVYTSTTWTCVPEMTEDELLAAIDKLRDTD